MRRSAGGGEESAAFLAKSAAREGAIDFEQAFATGKAGEHLGYGIATFGRARVQGAGNAL